MRIDITEERLYEIVVKGQGLNTENRKAAQLELVKYAVVEPRVMMVGMSNGKDSDSIVVYEPVNYLPALVAQIFQIFPHGSVSLRHGPCIFIFRNLEPVPEITVKEADNFKGFVHSHQRFPELDIAVFEVVKLLGKYRVHHLRCSHLYNTGVITEGIINDRFQVRNDRETDMGAFSLLYKIVHVCRGNLCRETRINGTPFIAVVPQFYRRIVAV